MTTAMWRADELAVLEIRPFWRKRVVIFGRSIPIAVLALAIFTVSALAWGAYLLLGSTVSTTVDVKSAPAVPSINYGNFACTVQAGSGVAGAPSWNAGSQTLSCAFTDVDETSQLQAALEANNFGGTDVCLLNLSVPSDPALTISSSPAGDVALPPGANVISVDYDGNGNTLAAAGTQIGPLAFSFDTQASEAFPGGICP